MQRLSPPLRSPLPTAQRPLLLLLLNGHPLPGRCRYITKTTERWWQSRPRPSPSTHVARLLLLLLLLRSNRRSGSGYALVVIRLGGVWPLGSRWNRPILRQRSRLRSMKRRTSPRDWPGPRSRPAIITTNYAVIDRSARDRKPHRFAARYSAWRRWGRRDTNRC